MGVRGEIVRVRRQYFVLRLTPVTALLSALSVLVLLLATGSFARTAGTQAALKKRPIYSVDTKEPLAALGVNCAWGNDDIPELIRVLDEYGVKATFFVVGAWCDRFPESVIMLSAAGHEIASHSDSHANMTELGDAEIRREIRDSRKKLESVSGQRVMLFRVPSGDYNSRVIELIEAEGMYPIQWDCDSLDYKAYGPGDIRERVSKNLSNGSITLFHSGTKHTASALPLVLGDAKEKGFRFVKVSELIYPTPYTVDFEGRQRRAINNSGG